jgi:hypothetical protein
MRGLSLYEDQHDDLRLDSDYFIIPGGSDETHRLSIPGESLIMRHTKVNPMQHAKVRREGVLYEASCDDEGLFDIWRKLPKLEPDDPPTVSHQIWRRGDPPLTDPEVLAACAQMKVEFPTELPIALVLKPSQARTLYKVAVEALTRYDQEMKLDNDRVSLGAKQEVAAGILDLTHIVTALCLKRIRLT